MTNQAMYKLFKEGKMEQLGIALEENIRIEIETGKGTKKKDISIIKNLLKAESCKHNQNLKKAHEFNYDGKIFYGFTEGYRILASESDFSYEHSENPMKFEKMISDSEKDCTIEFKVDIKDVKKFIALSDKKNKKPYRLEIKEGLVIGINPEYLIDSLDFCDTDSIYVQNNPRVPMFVKGNDRVSIILPVNLEENAKKF